MDWGKNVKVECELFFFNCEVFEYKKKTPTCFQDVGVHVLRF